MGQEGRELRVGDVPKRTWSFAEIDGQLFIVLSALTDGESFDVVMSAGGDHGFETRTQRGERDVS